MMYATVGIDGKFTGVTYTELTQAVKDWHSSFGFTYRLVDSPPVNLGTDNNHDYGLAPSKTPEEVRQELKAKRDAAVAAIVVTTSTGKQFNGDETSQTRMARAIVGMQASNATTIRWVLADNTDTEVTLAELSEALVLAGQAQEAIWVIPE